jgi:hypothetical protein
MKAILNQPNGDTVSIRMKMAAAAGVAAVVVGGLSAATPVNAMGAPTQAAKLCSFDHATYKAISKSAVALPSSIYGPWVEGGHRARVNITLGSWTVVAKSRTYKAEAGVKFPIKVVDVNAAVNGEWSNTTIVSRSAKQNFTDSRIIPSTWSKGRDRLYYKGWLVKVRQTAFYFDARCDPTKHTLWEVLPAKVKETAWKAENEAAKGAIRTW